MKKIPELPNKLSELIKIALGDLELVENDERYYVHMSTWHAYSTIIDKCLVCFAGSVLAKTCKADIREFIAIGSEIFFHPSIANQLNALDHVRMGEVLAALGCLRYPRVDMVVDTVELFGGLKKDEHWVDYEINKEGFKLNMQTLIGVLESEGL